MKKTYKMAETFEFRCKTEYSASTFRFWVRKCGDTVKFDALCRYNGENINFTDFETDDNLLKQLSETVAAYKLEQCNGQDWLDDADKGECEWSLEIVFTDGTSLLADWEHKLPKGSGEGFAELKEYLSDYAQWCKEGDSE